MTDKEMRSLSKIQLLGIMRLQEMEIMRLAEENEGLSASLDERKLKIEQVGSLAEASVMLSGLLQSAQETAEIFLENVKMAESEKVEAAKQIEDAARQRAQAIIDEAERTRATVTAYVNRVAADMQKIFDWQLGQIQGANAGFQTMLQDMDFTQAAGSRQTGGSGDLVS